MSDSFIHQVLPEGMDDYEGPTFEGRTVRCPPSISLVPSCPGSVPLRALVLIQVHCSPRICRFSSDGKCECVQRLSIYHPTLTADRPKGTPRLP